MSQGNFDDVIVIESTPVRTVRNLKNRQSLTSIKGDADSEDSYEKVNCEQDSDTNIPPQQLNGNKQKNMEEYIKKVEQFSNDMKPSFKKKQQFISSTTIQIQRHQSQEDNRTTPSTSSHRAAAQKMNVIENMVPGYGLADNTTPSDSRNTGRGSSQSVVVQSYLKNNSKLSQQIAYGQTTLQQQSSTTELPLGDKTNNFQQSDRRSFRRFKNKINTMNEAASTSNNQNGQEENASEVIQKTQYVNIDMEYALHFVLSKSKAIKEKIENENISQDFVNRAISQSRSFKIEYNMFLQKQVHHKILSPEFKNVSKKMFEKLERFFINRLEKEKESQTLQQQYKKQSQNVKNLLQDRIQQLMSEMNDPFKIQLSA